MTVSTDNSFEKSMIKTTIATASAVVAVFVAVVLVFSFGFPSLMGKLCKNVGLYNFSVGFYERAYDRSGKADDYFDFLDCATFLAEKTGDYEKIADRGDDVIKFKDELVKDDDYDYFAIEVVRAKYSVGNKQAAAEFAVKAAYGDRTKTVEYAKMLAEKDGEFKTQLDKYLN